MSKKGEETNKAIVKTIKRKGVGAYESYIGESDLKSQLTHVANKDMFLSTKVEKSD